MNNTRESGKITHAEDALEDHGIRTVMVWVSGDGWAQCFGGLVYGRANSDEERAHRESFVKDLCTVFGVAALGELVGKECYALRSWKDYPSGSIEGLESVDTSRRFILTRWRRKHWPDTQTSLEERRKVLEEAIERGRRDIERFEATLPKLASLFVDWEAM